MTQRAITAGEELAQARAPMMSELQAFHLSAPSDRPSASVRAMRPVVRAVPRTKTSVDIMNERDEYRARVRELEAVLKAVRHETEMALEHSELQPLTICRISCIARRAVGEPGE